MKHRSYPAQPCRSTAPRPPEDGLQQPKIMDAEQLLAVGPGIDRAKAGARRQGAKLGNRILVGIFGVDQLALGEEDRLSGDPSFLVGEAAYVDFNPSFDLVVE